MSAQTARLREALEAVKEMMKQRYCLGDKPACARYMVFRDLGKAGVPAKLIPNQTDKAREIISRARLSGGI